MHQGWRFIACQCWDSFAWRQAKKCRKQGTIMRSSQWQAWCNPSFLLYSRTKIISLHAYSHITQKMSVQIHASMQAHLPAWLNVPFVNCFWNIMCNNCSTSQTINPEILPVSRKSALIMIISNIFMIISSFWFQRWKGVHWWKCQCVSTNRLAHPRIW